MSGLPSGSVDAEPSSVTVVPATIPVWAGPASAVGAPFAFTATSTVAGVLTAPNWSVTTSLKCRVDGPVPGATKVGIGAVALESVTASGPVVSGSPTPSTWVHA